MSTVTNEEEFKSFLQHVMKSVSLCKDMKHLLACLKEAADEAEACQLTEADYWDGDAGWCE